MHAVRLSGPRYTIQNLGRGIAVHLKIQAIRASRLVGFVAGCCVACGSALAQYTDNVTIKGEITGVEADGFDLAGHHVIIEPDTEFISFYHTKKKAAQLRSDIEVGMWAQVVGTKDHSHSQVAAAKITLRDEEDRKISGVGLVLRVTSQAPETIVYADGYSLRVEAGTKLRFLGGLTKIGQVAPGIWMRYEGTIDLGGQISLISASFAKVKPPKQVHDSSLDQATTFPPDSFIDFDGSFGTQRGTHKMEDAGGPCGWYPVVEDQAMQTRVLRIGRSLIPAYQRNLPDDDPAKIHFRFYVVVERDIRSDLACHPGLVLIPLDVIDRLHNDDQLAAVLADGIALNIQLLPSRDLLEIGLINSAELTALSTLAGPVAGFAAAAGATSHDPLRRHEEDRGRIALGLMADAGYDPWQAPEAWRRLAPGELPRNPAKLKYPERSQYLIEILGLEYKKSGPPADASTSTARPITN